MPARQKRGVFISYSREDGEGLAVQLRKDLERDAPDLGIIWQDRAQLEAGIGWWKQITDAIHAAQFMLLVMTPTAMQSQFVAKEWRYARQQGVCVYPVMAATDLNFEALPRWMAKAHFHLLPQEWATLLGHLHSPCRANRVPFMAPDLPEHFVARSQEFDLLRGHLLEPDRKNPVAITTALRGAGGFGKTTLAVALCHDDDIQAAFDDGILWVTLGEKPDVTGILTMLYAAIVGQRPGFTAEEDAAYHLAERLQDKNYLIVIDDAWNPAHLQPFLRGGKGCARLVTTRLVDVVPEARLVTVDEMTDEEARKMLGSGRDAALLTQRLGNWPLMLELARGALVQLTTEGESLQGALEYLNQALAEEGMETFDFRNPVRRNQAIAASMEASLRLLAPEQRQRYQELAIFPEDVDIPLTALRILWGLNDFQTRKLVNLLSDLSLLKFDRKSGSIRLHDVVRAWMSRQVRPQEAHHRRLAEGWGDRYHLPDGYAWRWLAYHLVGANQQGALRNLLLDFDWMQAKLGATDVNALIADYDYLLPDDELELVQGTIRLSAHVVAKDANQLAGQLLGRLPAGGPASIEVIRMKAKPGRERMWLRPVKPTLLRAGGPLKRALTGHTHLVSGVALSTDGRRAVSASADQTLKVWDVESGAELATLTGHTASVNGVALSADGRRAVSASEDGTLKVWDVESGAELATLTGHTYSVSGVALSADGRRAVSASWDQTLKVWDVESGAELATLTGHTYSVSGVALSADGRRAVSASYDRTLKVWDVESGAELATLTGHTYSVSGVALSADGRRAVSASRDRTLKVWDVESGAELATFTGHTASVSGVALSADGCRAVSASDDRTLKVWDVESGAELATLTGHTDSVSGVALSADGRRAVSASYDLTLKVWDVESGAELATLTGHTDWVWGVALSADGCRAVSASWDRTLKVWDVESGAELATLTGHTDSVSGVALSADGRRAGSASYDRTLKVWDVESGAELATLTGHTGSVWGVALSADGRRAVSASYDRTLKVWDVERGAELATLTGHTASVSGVALSADGRRAVSASYDRTLKVWDVESGAELATLTGHTALVNGVALSADGRRAVSASYDRTLKVWDVESGAELATLTGHTASVNGVALSADGRRAVSASWDQMLKVWDVERGAELATFHSDGALYCCALAQDRIIAGGAGGFIHFLLIEHAGA